MVDKVKGGGRATPPPHQAGLIFPSQWNARQKVAIAIMCVLCGLERAKNDLLRYERDALCVTYLALTSS